MKNFVAQSVFGILLSKAEKLLSAELVKVAYETIFGSPVLKKYFEWSEISRLAHG